MKIRRLTLALLLSLTTALAACTSSDDAPPPPDDTEVDAGTTADAATACILPMAPVTCTVGNDGPCSAVCGGAYCHTFDQFGTVCTQACAPGSTGTCPTGWRCNNMGRCRPPN
jgi:hypothetical protein